MKVLFFHIPSLSMYRWLEPILLELCARGHCVSHYNESSFRRYVDDVPIRFIPYRRYEGYFPHACDSTMRLYDLGLLLLETAEQIVDGVEEEVLREAPDLIVHSKFVVAAKLAAMKCGVPAICLTTGCVFHPDIIRDQLMENRTRVEVNNVSALLEFRAKARRLYREQLGGDLDANDVFVNDELLNLVVGLKVFQPIGSHLSVHPTFVGTTVEIDGYRKSYEIIYVSLGGVFVNNKEFYQTCIRGLAGFHKPVIISLGNGLAPEEFKDLPKHVEVHRFVNQTEMLQKAAVFITQGGDRSVAEAIHSETPMIVVPQIPEQHYYARTIQHLGIGKYLLPADLTPDVLQSSVAELMYNPAFRCNVHVLKDGLPKASAAKLACDYIEQFACRVRGGVKNETADAPQISAPRRVR